MNRIQVDSGKRGQYIYALAGLINLPRIGLFAAHAAHGVDATARRLGIFVQETINLGGECIKWPFHGIAAEFQAQDVENERHLPASREAV